MAKRTDITPADRRQAIRAAFDMARDNRREALQRLLDSTNNAIAQLDRGEWTSTDFVSQHAQAQAEALHKMSALSEALSIASFQVED